MPYTAIVILNYNNYEDTFNCIDSIEKYNSARIKFFVVDNASPRAGTVDALSKYLYEKYHSEYVRLSSTDKTLSNCPKMTFIVSNNNGGYAQGNNIGLRFAFADQEIDSILVINNDVLFVEDIIPSLIERYKVLPNCALVSPLLYKKDMVGVDYCCARTEPSFRQMILSSLVMGKPWFGIKAKIDNDNYILKKQPEYIEKDYVPIDFPSGSCMLASKDVWLKIDGFDPNTFLYYEEAILFKKTAFLGLQNFLIPSLKCIHLGASSTSKEVSPKQTKLSFKSKKYYYSKYVNLSLPKRLLLKLVLMFNELALFLKFDILKFQNYSKRK